MVMEKNNIPAESRQTAIDYKKNIAGKFMLVEGAKIKSRVDGTDFCVTRKIDGHLQCLFYQDGTAYMLNSGGNQLAEQLRCIDAFAEAMQQAGVSSAIVAAELFMPKEGGRPRCADVKRALADPALRDELRLAPFDILEVNGEPWKADHYKHTHAQLCQWFHGDYVIPVDMMKAESLEEVQTIYDEWVECQGAEGLVIHSDSHIICKVKPRHTIDAVIVGYTTGDKGVRDLMMAVRKEDGLFQVFAVGSGGLSDEARLSLLDRLCQQHVESQYILSDSRGIAYQMVKPEIVFELSVIELVAKGNDDKVRTNALLTFDEEKGWLMNGMTPGVSAFGLVFEREREDKSPTPSDIRISQLTDLCPFEEQQATMGKLEKSELLERRVFRKISGDKIMLHKFLIWKTNKERTGRYPAYIFYHTDYSSGRKDILKRDMSYSSDEQQIRSILASEMESNIKKGWEEVA
jgi:hypothetical protein